MSRLSVLLTAESHCLVQRCALCGGPAKYFYFDKILSATSPILFPIFIASALSASGTSAQPALGLSLLQNAGKHFEMPTHEQLNSPTIHFSFSAGVPGGDALMKSDVHQSGIGSSASPRAGITFSMSSLRKPLVRFANFVSSGP